jgi:uncharacterized protein (DUF2164 family)
MPITLTRETKKALLPSIKRYMLEELDQEIGDLKADLLLDYILKEIGPAIYNRAIADAQAYFQKSLTDLEGFCFEKEMPYWHPAPSSRKSR